MSTWRNKEFPRCKKRDQRKWSVSPSLQSDRFLIFKISNISSMFYITVLILTFYLTAFVCFISYLSRKGKSRPGKESDTSRHTTTTWRASWRITQMAFLWRSESSLRLAVTDEQSVNTKRLEMQSGILLWHKGSYPTACNMLDCYWKAASCATIWVPFLLLRCSQWSSVKEWKAAELYRFVAEFISLS